jgi:hypothetical protein
MGLKLRVFFLPVLCLLLIRPCQAEEKKPFWSRFSLKVTAGWGSRIPIGDVNDVLKSFNDNKVFEFHRQHETGLVLGEIKTLDDRISHWEAELRFDLTQRISLGIATSPPIHKRNESSLTYTIRGWAGDQIMTWTFKPEIKVSYPIRLSAYYTLRLINRLSFLVGGGVGLYAARISQFTRYNATYPAGDTGGGTSSRVAKRNFALGFHGNVILEYSFRNWLAFVAEFQPRYVRIRNFKGTLMAAADGGNSAQVAGTLFYFTGWASTIGARLAAIEIMEKPQGGGINFIKDIRKAELDLSSYSLTMGLRIRLF